MCYFRGGGRHALEKGSSSDLIAQKRRFPTVVSHVYTRVQPRAGPCIGTSPSA